MSKLEGSLASGAEAAAHVAYGWSDLVVVQPLSEDAASGSLGGIVAQWAARGRENAFGRVAQVNEAPRSECSGAQVVDWFHQELPGARQRQPHDDATSASDGEAPAGHVAVLSGSAVLLRMLPNLHKLAAAHKPVVLHVAALRLPASRGALETDTSDVTALRESGAGILCASSVQEVHDLGVIAHLAAHKLQLPFVNFFDGARLTSEMGRCKLLGYAQMRALESVGHVNSKAGAQLGADAVEAEMANAAAALGKRYRAFEYFGPAEPHTVVVAMGTVAAAVLQAVRARIAKKSGPAEGKDVGVLRVVMLRPWSVRALLQALPASTRRLCVLDQSRNDTPLFKDVAVAVLLPEAQWNAPPQVISGNVVVNSKTGFTPALAQAVLDNLVSERPLLKFTAADLVAHPLSRSVSHLSDLVKQTVSWSMGERAPESRSALALALGPFLGLNVQHNEQVSLKTGISRTDLRYSPADIAAAPYAVMGADGISCDDVGLLLLPQVDVLAQARHGTKLVVNAAWRDVAAAEADLGAAVLARLASAGVELFAVDATAMAGAASNWVLQAALAKLCEGSVCEYRPLFSRLSEIIRGNVPNSQGFVDNLSDKNIAAHLQAIDLRGRAAAAAAEHDEEESKMLDFTPQDMFPRGLLLATPAGQGSTSASDVAAYRVLLEQLFDERLVVADTTNEAVPSALEADAVSAKASLEMCFGKYLVKAQARKRLVDFVARILGPAGAGVGMSKELLALLGMWHGIHANAVRCGKVVPRLVELLQEEKHKSALLEYVYNNRALLHKSSKWIVGGSNWAYDLSNSGIRHIITSGEDVNVLILDSDSYAPSQPQQQQQQQHDSHGDHHHHHEGAVKEAEVDLNVSAMSLLNTTAATAKLLNATTGAEVSQLHPAQTKPQHHHQHGRKKDIGLYAMNYGTAYVASVSVAASHSQAMRALTEADAFKGPSIVLAQAPSAGAAAAVDSGAWPLYRWNPSLDNDEFSLDSSKLKQEIQEFLKKEQNLSILANASPALPESLSGASLEAERAAKADQLHRRATQRRINEQFDSLVEGAGDKGGNPQLNLLVLYGSDSGHGAGIAEKLAKKAQFSGCGESRCMEAKDFSVDQLSEEKLVLLVLSTAGQGEPCGNAKSFSDALAKRSAKLPASLKFAVYGLGDSHYWGKGTEESAKYFCLNARQVDEKLAALGATRLVPCGLGDDQHDDGFAGALVPWEEQLWSELDVTIKGGAVPGPPPIVDDDIKIKSNYLRGMIDEGLADLSTGKLLPEDCKLTKFHGIYQQDLRTVREELDAKGLERAYSFMIRIGVPGGVATSDQYIQMDNLCDKYANGALKITTRQAYQFHGIVKKNLKATMKGINRAAMDTLAACGDVNRNIIANPHHRNSPMHAQVNKIAVAMQAHLRPRTTAYAEIWLDQKPVAGSVDHEPIYGETYLPRKFKIALAIPPLNDVDVFAHCLGYIAITQGDRLLGFNVCVGGGMGTTHGNVATYPRLSDVMGFCLPDQAIKISEAVVIVQRDHGERQNRKHARLKYTVEDMGVDLFRSKVEQICGFKLQKPHKFHFDTNADPYGWSQGQDGTWQFTMFIEHGYIKDTPEYKIKTCLREIAEMHVGGEMNLTATQNLIIGAVPPQRKPQIQAILDKYGVDNSKYSAMRLHSMACVAMPTCALAMAESQTYLPSLVSKLEPILDKYGLRHDAITIRMTGCPNGCGRSALAEIGFIGKAMGIYNLYLGGGFAGQRINKMYKEGVDEKQILEILEPMFRDYAKFRHDGERFGDFCIRHGIIEPTMDGRSYWAKGEENIKPTKDRGLNVYW